MAHEQSITIEVDGQYYNIPTVYQGKKVKDDDAFNLFMLGKIKPLGPAYKSLDEAVGEAKKRSAEADKKPHSHNLKGVFY